MKTALSAFVLAIVLPNLAHSFTGSLMCREVSCENVQSPANGGSWCTGSRAHLFGKIDLHLLNHENDAGEIFGDLNKDGGDQYEVISFKKSEISALVRGHAVFGTYTDSYSWGDGDHVRFVSRLQCFLK